MFRCTVCGEKVGPGIKPIPVIASVRPVSYENIRITYDEYEREHKEKVQSNGTEIVSVDQACRSCAGVPEEAPKASLPAFLARVRQQSRFEEKLAPPLRPKVIALAVHAALERTNHKSKRAQQEVSGTVPTIKQFVEHNPKLVF